MAKDKIRDESDKRRPDWEETEGIIDKQEKIKVPIGVYIVSVVLVALVVFIVMLVQYLPGHRQSALLSEVVDKAEYVYVGVRIPTKYLAERDLSYGIRDEIEEMLKDMGAKDARVDINPNEDEAEIPGENSEGDKGEESERDSDEDASGTRDSSPGSSKPDSESGGD